MAAITLAVREFCDFLLNHSKLNKNEIVYKFDLNEKKKMLFINKFEVFRKRMQTTNNNNQRVHLQFSCFFDSLKCKHWSGIAFTPTEITFIPPKGIDVESHHYRALIWLYIDCLFLLLKNAHAFVTALPKAHFNESPRVYWETEICCKPLHEYNVLPIKISAMNCNFCASNHTVCCICMWLWPVNTIHIHFNSCQL